MKVLVVGSGGRCHAIVKALSKSKQVTRIYAAPGNAGMSELATLIPISATNVSELLAFAKIENMDLTVVGPEVSLAAGIVNEFENLNKKLTVYQVSLVQLKKLQLLNQVKALLKI